MSKSDWLHFEWPLLAFWGTFAALLLLPLAVAPWFSVWWLLPLLIWLPVWWFLAGRTVAGMVYFLICGSQRHELTIRDDGIMFLSTNDAEPVFAQWMGFVNKGSSFLLWGGDGRYRLVIPKRVLTPDDYEAIRGKTGVDLTTTQRGQEIRLPNLDLLLQKRSTT